MDNNYALNNGRQPPQPKKSKIFIIIITSIILVSLGILFILDKVASPGIDAATACFAAATNAKELTIQRMESTTSQTERKEIFCKEDKESFDRLMICLEQVKIDHSISIDILEAFPKYKGPLQEAVIAHNKTCADQPISLP